MAADSKAADKTRRERRKEARIEKNKKKFDSWIQHHQSRKLNKSSSHSKSKNVKILQKDTQNSKEREFMLNDLYDGSDSNLEQPTMLVNSELKSEALEHIDSNALTVMKRKKGSTKKSKTKFGKHLEMDTGEGVLSAEEDLRLEKKLAKNLNVKDGKLRGVDDSINALLEVTPSAFDSVEKEESPGAGEVSRKSFKNDTSRTKHKKRVSLEEELKGEMTYDSFDGMLQPTAPKKTQLDSVNNSNPAASKISKRKKTKFEEYLEMNMKEGVVSVEEDFALERKLAKKLKVKKGKLRGDDDELNMLFEGIPSILEDAEGALMKSLENIPLRNKPKKKSSQQEILDAEEASVKSLENISVRNKRKKKSSQQETPDAEEALVKSPENISVSNKRKKKSSEQDLVFEMADDTVIGVSEPVRSHGAEIAIEKVLTKAPASEGKTKYVAPHLRSTRRNESEEHSQIRRRLRGLLNRLSESNVEAITGEVSTIFHSVARSVGSEIISEEVLASCSGGPRGNEQYAAVFAAFVAGMACLVGSDFSAKLLASLAKTFEDEYLKEDNLSLRNLTLLLSYLYAFGVCSSDLIYDFMIILSKRLMEVDVSIILTILQCCGMKLRSDDPAVMKNFILSVQNRVTELKASTNNDQEKMKSKRMEFMLETICDIKNNKKRPKEDTLQHTRTKKWLQKLAIENVLIRGLKWSKLLDPDKKGQWWLSGDMASTTDNIKEVARKIDWEVPETQKMLQLASAQRMNTDARRAIFCIIMSGEDYIDTFEKLLRLDLPGKQDREIMRVLVECCLQEKVFNKYYCVLASKLCSHDKNHKFTLQYCLWDHFKEVESMQLLRSMHLSKFVAEMLASFSLSLAVLKVVDLNDTTQLSPKRIMHFRMLFEAIFDFSDKLVWNMFTRIAATPEYETLRNGIEFFISKYVVSGEKSFAQKLKLAKKALNNVKGIIM